MSELGFELYATGGTATAIQTVGIDCQRINKVNEGRPHLVDMIKNDQVSLIINTTEGKQALKDSASIRRTALQHKVAYSTTIAGAEAVCMALKQMEDFSVRSLGELHKA